MNYYEHHIGDYLKDTSRLSLTEHGVYLLLLSDYYANEAPLPTDYASLCRIARAMTRAEQASVRCVVDAHFPIGEDGKRHNKRADDEITKARKRIETSRANGAKRKPKGNPQPTQRDTQQDSQRDTRQTTRSGEALQNPHAIYHHALGNSPPDSNTSNARDHAASGGGTVDLAEQAMRDNPALGVVVRLRKRGGIWLRLTPENPEIHAAVAEGVTVESIEALAEAYPDKPPLYVIRAARSDRAATVQTISTEERHAKPIAKPSGMQRTEAALREYVARAGT